jgi:uncharacterized protein (UPF0276 family)
MPTATVPRLGPGAVYCEALHPLFEAHPDLIRVAEIEPSSAWIKAPGASGAIRSNPIELERIAALPQAKLVHGVGYPVGGTICDQDAHVGEQRRWAERLGAPWTSEHLSFNDSAAGPGGFLLPPEQSRAGVALAADNIRARAAALGDRPFAFETGVSYLAPRPGELADGDFFAAVAEAADCLILLDLHNLWTNERNGRQRVADVLAALPLERVCEMHLAGGMEKDGYWLDAHSGTVPLDVMALASEIVPAMPTLGAIIFEVSSQFLDAVPPALFLRQMEKLHLLWERAGHKVSPRPQGRRRSGEGGDPSRYEQALVRALAGPPRDGEDSGVALYRTLIASFRNGALADLLPHTLGLLRLHLGEAGLDSLLAAYRESSAPPLFPADEALAFAAWFAANGPEIAYAEEVLGLEAGIVRLISEGGGGELRFRHDPTLILNALEEGCVSTGLPEGDFRIALDLPGVGGKGVAPVP